MFILHQHVVRHESHSSAVRKAGSTYMDETAGYAPKRQLLSRTRCQSSGLFSEHPDILQPITKYADAKHKALYPLSHIPLCPKHFTARRAWVRRVVLH